MPFFSRQHKTPLGIYVHIPFCKSKCEYCDFYSLGGGRDRRTTDDYLQALADHIKETGKLAKNYEVDTVYFGGGTPSFFGAENLEKILDEIHRHFQMSGNAEITLEANPDSVTLAALKRLLRAGFNRISIGVQSDDDQMLQKLGRPHNFQQAKQAMQLARRSLGIQYGSMRYDAYFEEFSDVLFSYQFVRNETILTPGIMEWLYEHSAGIISVVVSLVHDAQEIAILSGKECLNLETLNMAYQQRLSLLHGYIEPAITKKPQTTTTKQNAPATQASANTAIENENIISQLVTKAKNQQIDLMPMLKDYMPIVEVSI